MTRGWSMISKSTWGIATDCFESFALLLNVMGLSCHCWYVRKLSVTRGLSMISKSPGGIATDCF